MMITDQMKEFNVELIEEVNEYREENHCSTEDSFTSVFSSYIIDAGESFLANSEIVSYIKKSEKIKINGYSYDEYFQTLTLIVSDYNNRYEIERMGKVEIDKTAKSGTRFFRACRTGYFKNIEESSPGYQIYEFVKDTIRNIENIKVVILTNRVSANYIPSDIKIDKTVVKFDIWDLERVCQYVYQNKVQEDIVIRLKNKYGYSLQMIKVAPQAEDYDCYVGIMPGECIASIYKDEGQKLIEKNVRSFLQATGKINKGLKYTLINEAEMFMAYNNGISTIADEIVIDKDSSSEHVITIKEIKNWQIVNGGQTTASIYNAQQNKVPLSNVSVQMKMTVIKNKSKAEEIIGNISKYANSQNKINMSDFSANDSYHVEIERLSRKTYIPVEQGKSSEKWFYERARGQYMVELNRQPTPATKRQFKEHYPKKKCISKTVAAKCLMCWMKYPDIVSRGLETNFIKFSEMIKNGELPTPNDESYKSMISKVILFLECDKVVESQKFGGYKAQVNYYTIALLSEFYSDVVSDDIIWKVQTISPELALKIEELSLKVWNHFMNPEVKGINITQWCKKEECWSLLKKRYKIGAL